MSEKVKCDEGLWNKVVPKHEREIWVGAAESGNEVVFECFDSTLREVTAVDSCRGELVSDVFFVHVIFHQI